MKRLLVAFTLACLLSGIALAGDMPGVGGSVIGDIPTVGSGQTPTRTPAPGDMPAVGATSSETGSSLVTTVLLTIITLIDR